jgi:hypothetical protein
MAAFSRYIGIDYSGVETPEASLKGLRVYRFRQPKRTVSARRRVGPLRS